MTKDEIHAALSSGWQVEFIEPATIELTWDSGGAAAWQVAATAPVAGGLAGGPSRPGPGTRREVPEPVGAIVRLSWGRSGAMGKTTS